MVSLYSRNSILSARCLSALFLRERPRGAGSYILAECVLDEAVDRVARGAAGDPASLRKVDVDALLAECLAWASNPMQKRRFEGHADAVRQADPWEVKKAVSNALATVASRLGDLPRRSPELRRLLSEVEVAMLPGGPVALDRLGENPDPACASFLDMWRARHFGSGAVWLCDPDDVGARHEVVRTYTSYAVPLAWRDAGENELRRSFRPGCLAFVRCTRQSPAKERPASLPANVWFDW